MRVIFDGYWWKDGPISNALVQRQFILTWLHDVPSDDVTVVVPARHRAAVAGELGSQAQVIGTRARRHATAAAFHLPRIARRVGADVTIAHNFTPVSGTAITFIHDVLFQTTPAWFTPAERLYLAPIPVLAKRAAAVVTSSQHEAQRILTENPRLTDVTAIGLGVDPELLAAVPQPPAGLEHATGFVLTVGRLNIRKNLGRTIDAALDSGAISPEHPLVIVGEEDGRGNRLDGRANEARRNGSLVFLARVTTSELAWLYQHANLFVCLSLDEGWGFTPHEAEAFAVPSLVSDIPVFRESLNGQHTVFVDPLDTAAIASAISRQLADATASRPASASQGSSDGWSACVERLRDVALLAGTQH
jgi:glycosyltransferase involved in cell wall biosynthesis